MRTRLRSLFFWERDFSGAFFHLAIPIAMQSLVMASLHVVDNVMVGQLGVVEMAAVTQANRFTFLFQLTMFGLSGGTAIFAAQYWGRRDVKQIQHVLGLGLICAWVFVAFFGILAIGFPHLVIRILLKEEQAIELGVRYLRIVGIGYFFQAMTQIYATILKSTEQPRLPMVASVTSIVTNTVLNYGLIFGRLGLPRLGVEGAAIATVIATVLEAGLIIGLGYGLRLATAAKPRDLIPQSRAFVARYLRITGTVVANESLWALGILMYSVVYGRLGKDAVASVSIYNTVEQVGFSFLRGVTGAAAVLVGKYIGRDENSEAYFTSKRMMAASVGISALAGLILALCSGPITGIYGGISTSVAADAARIIRINALFMPLNALNGLIIVGILRSGGDATVSLVLDTGTVWLIGVPLVACAGLLLHFDIVMVVVAQMENLVKLALGMARFRSRRWMNNLTLAQGGEGVCNQGAD
ncbi:MAG TPA: MATE family efflux transporter [Clostridia bacterium]|nr:MATE family efflux transporter [Clostridia bacterium]